MWCRNRNDAQQRALLKTGNRPKKRNTQSNPKSRNPTQKPKTTDRLAPPFFRCPLSQVEQMTASGSGTGSRSRPRPLLPTSFCVDRGSTFPRDLFLAFFWRFFSRCWRETQAPSHEARAHSGCSMPGPLRWLVHPFPEEVWRMWRLQARQHCLSRSPGHPAAEGRLYLLLMFLLHCQHLLRL
jgi:hypothetical protein